MSENISQANLEGNRQNYQDRIFAFCSPYLPLYRNDRINIAQVTESFDKTVVDRTKELSGWVNVCQQVQKRGIMQCIYANNHYSGHAPATIEQFRDHWLRLQHGPD